MILSVIIGLMILWYTGYVTAFYLTVEKMMRYQEPFNKMDMATIKQLCRLSWLWVIILIMEYYER